MKAAILIVVLSTLIAGCAAEVRASSPRSVMIAATSPESAQAKANEECGKYRRYAQLVNQPQMYTFLFACVE